jgi:Uma2 family endonuclease
MSTELQPTRANPYVIHFEPVLRKISEKDFFEFCQANREWRIERTSNGDITITPPAGGETGKQNFNLTGAFYGWVKSDRTGEAFDSSTGFILPNGAERSPDLAWIRLDRWNALTEEERKRFPPLCPDFVVELRSPSDSLRGLQAKMQEYIENGAQLGWLIDLEEKSVYVYRPEVEVERLDSPDTVLGEPLLKGFILDAQELWK